MEGFVVGDLNGDGSVGQADLGILMNAYGKCEGQSGYNEAANLDAEPSSSCGGAQQINQADLGILMSYYGLTATDTLRATLTWDAENRLVVWEPQQFGVGAKRVTFAYDYLGRRVEKKVYTWDPNAGAGGQWTPATAGWRRFVWYGWLILSELDVSQSGQTTTWSVRRHYTWGMDLSQTGQGAGGIGGLLAAHDPNDPSDGSDPYGSFIYFFDANGNVGQLVDSTADPQSAAVIAAKYEYDAYGNNLLNVASTSQSGSYAAENPIRFSTKYWDDETGFGYWGYRYYSARFGRWLSRDPIFEDGGLHLFTFIMNRPIASIDAVGLLCLGPPKTYAVDGTAYTQFGSVLHESEPSNVWFFCKDTNNFVYIPGPGTDPDEGFYNAPGLLLGNTTRDRAVALRDAVCADACSSCPPSQINIVGWSRGAIAVLETADLLSRGGCCCMGPVKRVVPSNKWSVQAGTAGEEYTTRGCCRHITPSVNFLGLFDPVDMRLAFPPTRLPENVRNCTIIYSGGETRVMFPWHRMWYDPRMIRFGLNTDHTGVGAGKEAYDEMRKCGCDAGVPFFGYSHPGQ